MATAVWLAATRKALGHCSGQHEADLGEGTGDASSLSLLGGGGWHCSTLAPGIHPLGHIRKYIYCMTEIDLSTWVPRGVEEGAGVFARTVVAKLDLSSWSRARSLLWAASRLGSFALSCGLELEVSVVLSSPQIERFILVGTKHCSAAARRTLRSDLSFLARRVLSPAPSPVPLGRERAKAPYSQSELAAYLALADAQPTVARRQRASGLIALGAGAGLIGADLRLVRGEDVIERSGGVARVCKGALSPSRPGAGRVSRSSTRCRPLCGSGVHRGRGRAKPAQRDEPSHRLAGRRRGPARGCLWPDCVRHGCRAARPTSAWPLSWRPPGCAAPSASATWWQTSTRATRPKR